MQNNLQKANKKGTPQYEVWLRKYKENKVNYPRKVESETAVYEVVPKDKLEEILKRNKISDLVIKDGIIDIKGMPKEQVSKIKDILDVESFDINREGDNLNVGITTVKKEGFGNLSKANKKGTPQYEEWLRKYREKRGIINAEDTELELKEKVKDILEQPSIKSAATVLTEKKIDENQNFSAKLQAAKTNPSLLKKERQPVFANLFGNYPVSNLEFRDRTVTSPVEQVDVALALEPEEITDEIWNDPNWIATEKVDGARCTIICTPEATRLTARRQQYSTKPSTDYTNNLPQVRDLDLYSVLGDTIIDSEVVASNPIEIKPGEFGDSLSSTMSILGQEKDLSICVERMNKYGRLINFCFDIQRFQGQDLRGLPYTERMKYLDKALDLIAPLTSDIKRVAQQKEGESKKEFFNRVVSTNGEGLVLAKADGPYIAFDRKNRLKAKRHLEYTLQVMDVLEGVGRNKGKAGSFIMGALINGQLQPVAQLNVGSDELREDVWKNQQKYIGKQIEVKSMQWAPAGKLRHPRWKTPGMFRDEKTTPDDLTEIYTHIMSKRGSGKLEKAVKGTPQYEEWKRKFLEALKNKQASQFLVENRFFMEGDEAKEVLSFKDGKVLYEDAYDKEQGVNELDLSSDIKDLFQARNNSRKHSPKKLAEKKKSSRQINSEIRENLNFDEGTDFRRKYFSNVQLENLFPDKGNSLNFRKWRKAIEGALNSKEKITGHRFASINDVINMYRKLK